MLALLCVIVLVVFRLVAFALINRSDDNAGRRVVTMTKIAHAAIDVVGSIGASIAAGLLLLA